MRFTANWIMRSGCRALTSAAVVSVPAGEGRSGGTRPLTEAELLSLVALGRLDLSGELATGGVAGAQSAPVLPISSRRSCSASLSSEASGRLTKIEIRLRSIR